ncbi:MAG: FixH family protein [Methyloceanibacter sp.]
MISRLMLIAAGFAAAGSFAMQARAGADDYIFEPVKPEFQKGDATLAVRLVQKSTSKPVADAVIVRSRVDMGPDGMPTMESQLKPEPRNEPGVYSFKTNLPMAGHWLLSIAAKVQGEPETVVGKITYTVTP